jgi:hypothetical protein
VTTGFTIDYTNGLVKFSTANLVGDVITADFVSNETIPADIKQATILMTSYMIGQAQQNPLGVNSYSIQTYSINFGGENTVEKRFKELLDPYVLDYPKIL